MVGNRTKRVHDGSMRFSAVSFYFVVFSFIGWIVDTFFRTIAARTYTTGSFFPIPFCPIYGFGVVLILLLRPLLVSHALFWQWLAYATMLGVLEASSGELILAVFHRELWGYSHLWISFGHFTNIFHMAIWGCIAVFIARVLVPWLSRWIPLYVGQPNA